MFEVKIIDSNILFSILLSKLRNFQKHYLQITLAINKLMSSAKLNTRNK